MEKQIVRFIERNPEIKEQGAIVTSEELLQLDKTFLSSLPKWYLDMVCWYPLVNAPIGIPHDFGQAELKGNCDRDLPLMTVCFLHPSIIQEEIKNDPTIAKLFKRGFLPFAHSEMELFSGHPICVKLKSPHQSLMVFYHDFGSNFWTLKKYATRLPFTLQSLFEAAKVLNMKRTIPQDIIQALKPEVQGFLEDLKVEINLLPEINSEQKELKEILIEQFGIIDGMETTDYSLYLKIVEWRLYDFKFPIDKNRLKALYRIYEIAGLHPGELIFFKNRLQIPR